MFQNIVESENFSHSKKTLWLAVTLIISLTLAIYITSLGNDFVDWDDYDYVIENSDIRSIDIEFLKSIFTTVTVGNLSPLTIFSFALDYSFWGLDPFGYHLTNLILHLLNTFLVFIFTYTLMTKFGLRIDLSESQLRVGVITEPKNSCIYNQNSHKKALITASVTSLLFGLHPLHVESVAWISERKDVLCAFFFC